MENLIKDIYVSLNGTCARLVRNYLLSKKKDCLAPPTNSEKRR